MTACARSADLARQAWLRDVALLTIASALDRHLEDGPLGTPIRTDSSIASTNRLEHRHASAASRISPLALSQFRRSSHHGHADARGRTWRRAQQ
jgi:hypothetical protein